MLLKDENILIGKLIGLLSGLDGDDRINDQEELVRESLKAVINKKDLSVYIKAFEESKKEYLPDCLTCTSRCDRSDDYYLNDHMDSPQKLELYNELISNYSDEISFEALVQKILRISYI